MSNLKVLNNTLIISLTLFSLNVFGQTKVEKNYLQSNKSYTDQLLKFLSTEETNNLKFQSVIDAGYNFVLKVY